MEVWDAYDSSFKLVDGVYLIRDEVIPEGLYHLVCQVLVQHVDGTYLLMQRDKDKSQGGMWEASAGGSALKGENAKVAAKRELFEETGIVADNLKEKHKYKFRNSILVEFFTTIYRDKTKIALQKGETQNFKWVNAKKLIEIKKRGMLTKTSNKTILDIENSLSKEKLLPNVQI